MDILYITQIYVSANFYIAGSCHNACIMGYHLYVFLHYTQIALSPICGTHVKISKFHNLQSDVDYKEQSWLSISSKYFVLSPQYILKPTNEAQDSHSQ